MSNSLIELDESTPFLTWAKEILPWLREAMADVAEGISNNLPETLARQERYTGYSGRLVELYSAAEAYYQTALAEAMEEAAKKTPASLVARIAVKQIKNELRVYEAIRRLNATLGDQLMAIASRLKYEGSLMWGQGRTAPDSKDLPWNKG